MLTQNEIAEMTQEQRAKFVAARQRLRERFDAVVTFYRNNGRTARNINEVPIESFYVKALEWIGHENVDPAKARGLDDLRMPATVADVIRHLKWLASKEDRAAEAAPVTHV